MANIFLLLSFCLLNSNGNIKDNVGIKASVSNITELRGGCLTSGNQTINAGSSPATVTATIASGGSCANYSYQWQISLDDVHFTDMGGHTSQNLSLTNPFYKTAWLQRKTLCGTEVAYTKSVKITVP